MASIAEAAEPQSRGAQQEQQWSHSASKQHRRGGERVAGRQCSRRQARRAASTSVATKEFGPCDCARLFRTPFLLIVFASALVLMCLLPLQLNIS
eukprot:3311563-Pleurochrysis_carterae.AAC.2